MLSKDWLVNRWVKSGLRSGDTVLLHLDIVRTLIDMRQNGFKPSAIDVLDSFIDLVGEDGTCLFPSFNFDFINAGTFDILNTPSHSGVVSELARISNRSIRTTHPVYSFSVIGKHANLFQKLNNVSAYGKGSPFDLLKELDGKIAVLDLDENTSMTFHHHVEEMLQVPYRYVKEFSGSYIDAKRQKSTRSCSIYVRRLEEKIVTSLNPVGELLWEKRVYSGFKEYTGTGLRVSRAKEIFKTVEKLILSGNALNMLYVVGD